MNRLLILVLAFTFAAPAIAADPPAPPKKAGKPPEFFVARRQAQLDRKAAQKERMHAFKAARAAAEEKAYKEWHERYVADAPVREQNLRMQASAYLAEAANARTQAAFFYAATPPPVIHHHSHDRWDFHRSMLEGDLHRSMLEFSESPFGRSRPTMFNVGQMIREIDEATGFADAQIPMNFPL